MGFLKRLLCSHDWKVAAEHDMPSPFEQLVANEVVVDRVPSTPVFYMKKRTTILTCLKCGATRIIRTQNCTRWD
jgi:predicted RNA-binding Zn-ribbon protein involved in translation (DUF1610 family)